VIEVGPGWGHLALGCQWAGLRPEQRGRTAMRLAKFLRRARVSRAPTRRSARGVDARECVALIVRAQARVPVLPSAGVVRAQARVPVLLGGSCGGRLEIGVGLLHA